MALSERFSRQPEWLILLEGFVATTFIGLLDYQLPYEWTVFVFYACPILAVGLYSSRRAALIMAFYCAIVWWTANYSTQPNNIQAFIWIALNRLATYIIVALAGSAMRQHRIAALERLRDLERTRELEEAIVRVSEREQMRIGQDLHDGLCQHLAALDCAITCLKQDLEEKNPEEAETAGFIQKQLSEALREARNMARGIFPVQINKEGFVAALQELVALLNRLRQFTVTLNVQGEFKVQDPQLGMHLYRIAQESLNNVIKHAKATHVTVNLTRQNNCLVMTISDDGVGIPESGYTPGLGMQTMRYRASTIGGTLEAHSIRKDGGTKIICKVPLAQEAKVAQIGAYDRDFAFHEN